MILGIEIGGTKLQLGVSDGFSRDLIATERTTVQRADGAVGILHQIEVLAARLLGKYAVQAIGVGFGGPLDSIAGVVYKSHQVEGWDGFDLKNWFHQKYSLPVAVANDCDVAALAEATWGAGQGKDSVFYVTVGTGIGGGSVNGGRLMGVGRPAMAEVGHLRLGLPATEPDSTVEAISSGLGIAKMARVCQSEKNWQPDVPTHQLTAERVGCLALGGDLQAISILRCATDTLGWAIAQVITLNAPDIIVIGGGVSHIGEDLFLSPLRESTCRYVFPPLVNSYRILPSALGESVVIHGAVALASQL
jgi:glucokinase